MTEESVIDGLVNTFIEYFGIPLAYLFFILLLIGLLILYARWQDKKRN